MSVALFAGSPARLVAGAVFAMLLLWICVTDVRRRRIPNLAVLVLALCGFAFSSIVVGPPLGGLARAMASLGVGFALWIPFYALRMLGAGDVKLFAAAATWLTPAVAAEAALWSAVIGGLLSLGWLVRNHGATFASLVVAQAARQPSTLKEAMPPDARHSRVPYGVAMALGLSLAAWVPHLLF